MTMPARSMSSSADPRYQLRHPLEKIDVAEITPQAGFTGKERDAAETGYDYGVYPALGGRARYYDSWRGQWLQVDPAAILHPDYSPYAYVFNNPLLLVDLDGRDSTQLAAAVAEAKKYVEKNPDRDPAQYKRGAKGSPGQAVDCSGVISNCATTAGVPDPNHGKGPNGISNIVANGREVMVSDAKPGQAAIFAINGKPNSHGGEIIGVQNSGGRVQLNVVQSGSSTGPAPTGFFTPGDRNNYWGRQFQEVRAWDTPGPTPGILNVWTSASSSHLFQAVSTDVTSVNY
jgi:RHS repeat-associated protein